MNPEKPYNNIKNADNVIKKNLILFRKKRGFTQQELANRVGLSLRTYASYEDENSTRMKISTLIEIANVLEIPFARLVV